LCGGRICDQVQQGMAKRSKPPGSAGTLHRRAGSLALSGLSAIGPVGRTLRVSRRLVPAGSFRRTCTESQMRPCGRDSIIWKRNITRRTTMFENVHAGARLTGSWTTYCVALRMEKRVCTIMRTPAILLSKVVNRPTIVICRR
jgi:hypothetical protein